MYIAVFIIISIFSLIELIYSFRNKKLVFNVIFLILTLMLCFRYGQGTDYLGYQYHYNFLDRDFSYFTNELSHGEIGWYIITLFFVKLGFTFEEFIFVISFLMMIFTYKGIMLYSPYKIFSLLLLYPTYFLTYYFSALRQGFILSLFLGFGISFLRNKKYFKYIFMVLMLATLHRSAIILLLLPVLQYVYIKRPFQMAFLVGAASLGIVYLGMFKSMTYLMGAENYLNTSISVPAYVIRLIFFIMIFFLHKEVIDRTKDIFEKRLYNMYAFGFVIFSMLFFSAIISQRLTMPLKALEVILIPIQLSILNSDKKPFDKYIPIIKFNRLRVISYVFVISILMMLECVKNINSYIVQGDYKEMVSPINYPYISIWNKEELGCWTNKVTY